MRIRQNISYLEKRVGFKVVFRRPDGTKGCQHYDVPYGCGPREGLLQFEVRRRGCVPLTINGIDVAWLRQQKYGPPKDLSVRGSSYKA